MTYDLPNSRFVTLKVYDMLGREVKTLVNEMKTAGFHEAQFTADELASGAYFYRLSVSGSAGEFVAVRKCVVVNCTMLHEPMYHRLEFRRTHAHLVFGDSFCISITRRSG
ncbi:MAG: T9SS type A sorting domain-containing protein [Ignavibacteria bacterium]|nr:T9SS type A sorting domain-containing protein [Ignavibacteria bacterium]